MAEADLSADDMRLLSMWERGCDTVDIARDLHVSEAYAHRRVIHLREQELRAAGWPKQAQLWEPRTVTVRNDGWLSKRSV